MNKWEKLLSGKLSSTLIAIGCALLWGSAFPTLKVAFKEFSVEASISGRILVAGFRFFGASMILFLISAKIGVFKRRIGAGKYLELFFLGIFQTTLQYFFFYNGLANITGMKAAVLASSGTFFLVVIAHFVYHDDRLSWQKTLGLITGFVGIVLANWGKGFTWSFAFNGEGFLLITGVVNAIGTIMAKRLSRDVHPFMVSGVQMLFGSLILLFVGFITLTPGITITPLGVVLLIYSAFLSAIAFGLWYSLLKYHKAGEISIFKFIIPIAGSTFSSIVLPSESFTLAILFALGFVSLGIYAVNSAAKAGWPKKSD